MYKVSNFIDSIKEDEPTTDKNNFAASIAEHSFYKWFKTYEEAKLFIINRTKQKIKNLEAEVKKLKRKLPKLRSYGRD